MSFAVALALLFAHGSAQAPVDSDTVTWDAPCPQGQSKCKPWERDWPKTDGPTPYDQSDPKPADDDFAALLTSWRALDSDPAVAWSVLMQEGDMYRIMKSELKRNQPTKGALTFWMRGDHAKNTALKYQHSLWNVTLNCDGKMRYNASTTTKADGSLVEQSDIQSPWLLIRPDTIFQSAESKLCPA
ncbi:MAG: hypothetical protein P0Y56_12780 [Candidatus Andeanibacterium colombiense]|uniref:Uncharacterized protein n=1 Tax=Candidatus Andeanibacterium colombiense TaxID=3121345 RepID=A0AAJ6BM07_9SPHN|nr:MAG: hypothetical protein P0Y56_12780 [Sphingomonadaceae bacterium]